MRKKALFYLLSLCLFSASAQATVYDVNSIADKNAGDAFSADDFNNIINVLRGVYHDNAGTALNYTDDFIGIGFPSAPTMDDMIEVNGNIQANYFKGDGSLLTGIAQYWAQNGSDINYPTGNVGIGTVTPGTALEVVGTVTATAFVGDASGLTGINGKFVDGTDPLEAVYTTGNVGIGTVNPTRLLEVAGGADFTGRVTVGGNQYDTDGALTLRGEGKNLLILQTDDNLVNTGVAFRNLGGAYSNLIYRTDIGNNDADLRIAGGDASTSLGSLDDYVAIKGGGGANAGYVGIGTNTPVARLDVNGGIAMSVRSVSTSGAATANDYMILCDATAGNLTVTLPAASGVRGLEINLKKVDASANQCIADGNGSDQIDDGPTMGHAIQYGSISMISDGTQWWLK